MKVYTIESGSVTPGAIVGTFEIKRANVQIPAILVGEEGRGRHLGVLPVRLLDRSHEEWQEKGKVQITSARVGQSTTGRPKLYEAEAEDDPMASAIVVFRTKIGYRGGNSHTGDCVGEEIRKNWLDEDETCPIYADFPGEILCSGVIAQGDAGRMGSGEQLVAVIPPNKIFRTAYRGRLYGAPREHYYAYRNQLLLGGLTKEERELSDLF